MHAADGGKGTVRCAGELIRGSLDGRSTRDKVWLLSVDEAYQYFKDDETRICTATKYAYAQKVGYGKRENGIESVDWWLRSHGDDLCYVAFISFIGSVDEYGRDNISTHPGVRPVVCVLP